MKKIILIATLLVFVGCSSDEKKETTKKVVETKEEAIKAIEEKVIEKKIEQKPKTVVKATKNGEELYKACAACHGTHGEKAALGKSKIIKGWEASKTETALNGYKDGTYGGAMKGLMKGQAGFLSAEEIKTVSKYISKL